MAEFMRCNKCGTVFPVEDFLFSKCENKSCGSTTNFTVIGAWGAAFGQDQTTYTNGSKTDVKLLAQQIGSSKRTKIKGVITVNYKNSAGKILPKQEFKERELDKALERIANGGAMPIDASNNTHRNDGTTFNNHERYLPVQAGNYYTEYGVLVGSVGWEVRVSSERLVVGRCWDIYYTSEHYKAGSWWVFNTVNGTWNVYTH